MTFSPVSLEKWAPASGGMPDGVDEDEVAIFVMGEVDVVSRPLKKDSPKARNCRAWIGRGGCGRRLEHLQRGQQFVAKEIGSRWAVEGAGR